jgi:hypothetical protein
VQEAYAGLVQQHRQQAQQLAAQQGAGSTSSSCGKHGCKPMRYACCMLQALGHAAWSVSFRTAASLASRPGTNAQQ